jgi:hypothetical protein
MQVQRPVFAASTGDGVQMVIPMYHARAHALGSSGKACLRLSTDRITCWNVLAGCQRDQLMRVACVRSGPAAAPAQAATRAQAVVAPSVTEDEQTAKDTAYIVRILVIEHDCTL